jgi:outer membrane lipoprotein SlyB
MKGLAGARPRTGKRGKAGRMIVGVDAAGRLCYRCRELCSMTAGDSPAHSSRTAGEVLAMRNATRTGWRWRALLGGTLVSVVLGGCESMNNTDKGVLAGGGLGAVAGALAGGPRHAGAGALAGGVIGAVAGGLTGAAIDHSEKKQAAREAALRTPPLSLEDVVKLTSSGASDEVIINQIRSTGSVYQLAAEHIIWLQNNGVREPVIREMQATAARPPRVVYTAQPVYVVQPAPPPPPVGVGLGVTWVGGRR